MELLTPSRRGDATRRCRRPGPWCSNLQADKGGLTPIDLDPVLDGKPGIVRSQLVVGQVLAGSEYDADEARWLREPRACLTQVTSLGPHGQVLPPRGVLVWVTRLADATPVAGAEVVVRGKANQVLWRGSTDERGLARTATDLPGEERPSSSRPARATTSPTPAPSGTRGTAAGTSTCRVDYG